MDSLELQREAETPPQAPSHSDDEPVQDQEPIKQESFWQRWFYVFKQVFPVYSAVHIAFFITTCLSFLFVVRDFSWGNVPIYHLWQTWRRWDTGHYITIAMNGYSEPHRTAFFPLFPILERALTVITQNPLLSGLIISNVAGLIMLMVLYQMVREDFDHERAARTVLYISVFPTAFFFAAAYNQSVFMCFTLTSFYAMRRGNWWLAGTFGFFASLTRSAGLLLVLPFCYEYLRQHQFQFRDLSWLKNLRWNVVSVALIPGGVVVFAIYCYYLFGDPLAFSHAQDHWNHALKWPWDGAIGALRSVKNSSGLLSFQALRNLLELIPDALMFFMIVLSFVGPWRFPRTHWAYGVYAIIVFIFLQLFPVSGQYPLQSAARYMLELFPCFIMLATLGKYRTVNLHYLLISGAMLFFLLTQFLTGHWVV